MASSGADDETGPYASPPCFLHEVDPAYFGLARPSGSADAGGGDVPPGAEPQDSATLGDGDREAALPPANRPAPAEKATSGHDRG